MRAPRWTVATVVGWVFVALALLLLVAAPLLSALVLIAGLLLLFGP